MRSLLIALLLMHGAIHLIGLTRSLGRAGMPGARPALGWRLGAVWLLAALGFLASAALLATPWAAWWWAAALPALLLSQLAILRSWRDARAGTAVNLLVALPIALALLDLRPSSLPSTYRHEVAQSLTRRACGENVTDADLQPLPLPLQTYLRRVGVVGWPRVHSVRARWRAQMKRSPGAPWMDASAEQFNDLDASTRFFLMEASQRGIPFASYHRYLGAQATMQVKAASLFDVASASGPRMNQSETVTLFNDMCVLAPASLLDPRIAWTAIDDRSVRGVFTNGDQTAAATLFFDADGDLSNFVSFDRSQTADGKTYQSYPWSTPLTAYRDFGGQRLPSQGQAVWAQPEGDLVYGRFELLSVEYNVGCTDEPSRHQELRLLGLNP